MRMIVFVTASGALPTMIHDDDVLIAIIIRVRVLYNTS